MRGIAQRRWSNRLHVFLSSSSLKLVFGDDGGKKRALRWLIDVALREKEEK
jgi:hypothetical protein